MLGVNHCRRWVSCAIADYTDRQALQQAVGGSGVEGQRVRRLLRIRLDHRWGARDNELYSHNGSRSAPKMLASLLNRRSLVYQCLFNIVSRIHG